MTNDTNDRNGTDTTGNTDTNDATRDQPTGLTTSNEAFDVSDVDIDRDMHGATPEEYEATINEQFRSYPPEVVEAVKTLCRYKEAAPERHLILYVAQPHVQPDGTVKRDEDNDAEMETSIIVNGETPAVVHLHSVLREALVESMNDTRGLLSGLLGGRL